jgi:hypothetical protein
MWFLASLPAWSSGRCSSRCPAALVLAVVGAFALPQISAREKGRAVRTEAESAPAGRRECRQLRKFRGPCATVPGERHAEAAAARVGARAAGRRARKPAGAGRGRCRSRLKWPKPRRPSSPCWPIGACSDLATSMADTPLATAVAAVGHAAGAGPPRSRRPACCIAHAGVAEGEPPSPWPQLPPFLSTSPPAPVRGRRPLHPSRLPSPPWPRQPPCAVHRRRPHLHRCRCATACPHPSPT